MILSKAYLYSPEDQLLADYCRAFTHPTRNTTLRKLAQEGPMTVKHLASFHSLSLGGYSQHLEILRDTGLADYTPAPPFILYDLNPQKVEEVKKLLLQFLKEF